jgi:hypothetical protein
LTAQVAESQGLDIARAHERRTPRPRSTPSCKKLRKATAADEVDSVIICFTPPLLRSETEAIAMIHEWPVQRQDLSSRR